MLFTMKLFNPLCKQKFQHTKKVQNFQGAKKKLYINFQNSTFHFLKLAISQDFYRLCFEQRIADKEIHRCKHKDS